MLRTIRLENKPLCLAENGGSVYFGDARGNLFVFSEPFSNPKKVKTASGPVSAICFSGKSVFLGTWDGIVYSEDSCLSVGTEFIKCMAIFNNEIFVSIGRSLVRLDMKLNILEVTSIQNKIHCMDVKNGVLYFGTGLGHVTSYDGGMEAKLHDKSVLSLKNGLSGSCDCTLKRGNEIIFAGNSWIRSIYDSSLFTSGKDVIENGKLLYSHNDDVMGVLRIHGYIISIGLDFSIKIHENGFKLGNEEEEDLMKMLDG